MLRSTILRLPLPALVSSVIPMMYVCPRKKTTHQIHSMKPIRLAPSRVSATPMLEIRMIASLFRRYPSGRIVDQHSVKQIQTIVIQARNERLGLRSVPFWEGGFEVGERGHARPDVVVGRAEESARGGQYWRHVRRREGGRLVRT